MDAWFRWILRHRMLVLAACVVVTGLAAIPLSRAVIATTVGKLFFGEAPEYTRYVERIRQFSNDEFFVIAYEDDDPLSNDSLDRLKKVVQSIQELPDVARVDSLLRDQARGLFLSRDGRHAAVSIELTVNPDRTAERAPKLVRESLQVFIREGHHPDRIHRAGRSAILGEMMSQTLFNISWILPVSVVALLIIVLVLTRRIAPAFVSMGVALISVVWTMGLATLMDRNVNIMMTLIPAVVLVVAFSDVIHLWSAFLKEVASGKNREEAILASASDVGKACLLTSITTFVGFVCISLVPTPVFRQMGLVLGFGVAVALLLAMTLVPVLLSYLKPPPPVRPGWMDRVALAMGKGAARRPWTVIAIFGLALAASIAGFAMITFETDLAKRLRPSNRLRRDQDYFKKHFAGTNVLEVFVEAPGGEIGRPGFLTRVDAFRQELRKDPGVDAVISILDAVKLAGPVAMAHPDARRLVDRETGTLRLIVRTNLTGFRETRRLGDRIVDLGRDLRAEVTGLPFLLGWWLDGLLAGQRNGLVLSFILITLLMIIGFRSVRVGLWSMVPNALPLLMLGGWLGWTWSQVDSDILSVGMMAIGIGVDDTIHFVMRYRLEARRGVTPEVALERTLSFAGRAIVLTTIILIVGFLPAAMSDYLTLFALGTLMPGVLIVALLSDLILVPALVRVGWMRIV